MPAVGREHDGCDFACVPRQCMSLLPVGCAPNANHSVLATSRDRLTIRRHEMDRCQILPFLISILVDEYPYLSWVGCIVQRVRIPRPRILGLLAAIRCPKTQDIKNRRFDVFL